ncbi:MAG: ATP-binding protein [Candidatus Methanoplasma sp.]|nr:ATP-binding protein [Candidatus Methanoplasma sp.]
MEATADRNHPENVIHNSKHDVLKTAAMYGANASGKTKLIDAVNICKMFVILSHTHQVGGKLNHTPFAFDSGCGGKPTFFEVVFTAGETRYRYSFSYYRDHIVSEELFFSPNGREAMVFSRDRQKFAFNRDREIQDANSKKVRENVLYISVAAQFNYKIACDVVDWFGNNLMVIAGGGFYSVGELIEAMSADKDLKRGVIRALNVADLGITDMKNNAKTNIGMQAGTPLISALPLYPVQDIWFSHSVKSAEGHALTVDLPMTSESSGTTQLVLLAGAVIKALSRYDSTLVIDELGINLHPDICKWVVELFHDARNNRNNAQLIFNTHNTELQNLDVFRRDQIWFVEKDDTGASSLKSLSDYRERSDKNIRNGYLAGRYGGKPFISPEILF